MFKNHHLQMRVVKTPNTSISDEPTKPLMTPEEAHQLLKEVGKDVVKATVTVMVVSFVLQTASELIVRVVENR